MVTATSLDEYSSALEYLDGARMLRIPFPGHLAQLGIHQNTHQRIIYRVIRTLRDYVESSDYCPATEKMY